MNDQEFAELKNWIAYDQSDQAQQVREALAPMIQELAAMIDRAVAFAPQLPSIRRRKLQPYIRKAWMKRGRCEQSND